MGAISIRNVIKCCGQGPSANAVIHGVNRTAFALRIDATLSPPHAGDTVQLQVAPQHLHWFDPKTQARVA